MPESLVVILSSSSALSMSTGAATYRTVSDRFVATQLYETLVRLDCAGELRPGLASTWRVETSGRWSLRLRENASFWGGVPVTAADVVAAWLASSIPSVRSVGEATAIIDDRTLSLALRDSSELRRLSDLTFALRRTKSDSTWPEGTGAYRPVSEAASQRDRLSLVAAFAKLRAPALVVQYRPELDGRDRIDAGADLTFATDPQTLRYAAARSDFVSVPLPWDRTYFLVLPRGSSPERTPADDTTRAALARDAVHADARVAASIGPTDRCLSYSARPGSAEVSERITYRADDPTAQQLAERLVALAGMRAGGSLTVMLPPNIRASGISPSAFETALAAGASVAFVVDGPASRNSPCPFGASPGVLPLIETREHAIVRRDRVSFVLDADGVPRIIPAAAPE